MVSRSQKVAGTCEKVSCAGVDPGFYVRGVHLKKNLVYRIYVSQKHPTTAVTYIERITADLPWFL
jgi:hypothetical protein